MNSMLNSPVVLSHFVLYNPLMLISAPPTYAKLQELIVCLAERASDIGKTKLEKLMYLCDFEATRTLGKSISEDTYRNFRWGPVPKHFVPALEILIETKRIQQTEIPTGPDSKFIKFDPKEHCNRAIFSDEEWKVIESVLAEHGNKTAKELVTLTHDELPWMLTERNEDIPYFLAHYRTHKRPTQTEVAALLDERDYVGSISKQLSSRQD
jgi:uncharacterized phage-associated protein